MVLAERAWISLGQVSLGISAWLPGGANAGHTLPAVEASVWRIWSLYQVYQWSFCPAGHVSNCPVSPQTVHLMDRCLGSRPDEVSAPRLSVNALYLSARRCHCGLWGACENLPDQ